MVKIKIWGGLGNQMFQYALARSLSIKNNTYLQFDLTDFEYSDRKGYTKRKYELNLFNIQYLDDKKENFLVNKFLDYVSPIQYIQEKDFKFDCSILYRKGRLYLSGFWQSERYFKDIEDIIRNDFTFKFPPDEINKSIINKAQSCNSVSIHFRRGDFVSLELANGFNGVCSLDYYESAISKIKNIITKPHFFVFSDDIEWVKRNVIFEDTCTYIEHNCGDSSFEDMRLMSSCKNHIIANSTFSWWGAWLNPNPEKIIITPARWFKIDDTDIIPNNWLKI